MHLTDVSTFSSSPHHDTSQHPGLPSEGEKHAGPALVRNSVRLVAWIYWWINLSSIISHFYIQKHPVCLNSAGFNVVLKAHLKRGGPSQQYMTSFSKAHENCVRIIWSVCVCVCVWEIHSPWLKVYFSLILSPGLSKSVKKCAFRDIIENRQLLKFM